MKWEEQDSKLTKKFEAKSFSDICEKLNQLAPIANQMDHHPDFEVSGYKYIQFTLFTHSENRITELDHRLAQKIDSIFR